MADIIYYNLEISQNSVGNGSIYAEIQASNNIPILDKPNEYYGSIIKMITPQFNIPIGYCDIAVNSSGIVSDINQTILSFTLSYNGTDITTPVYWVQQDFTVQPPPVGTVGQVASSYYFIYDYPIFISMWNTALKTCYDALAIAETLPVHMQPYFYYYPNTQIIQLYANSSLFDQNTPGSIQIFSNNNLEPYIAGFSYKLYNDPVKSILFNVSTIPNATTPLNIQTISTINYIVVQQGFQNLTYWNMLEDVIVSTSMNVQQEGFYIGSGATSQNLQLQSILTNYTPDLTTGAGAASSIFYYNASSLYRIFQINQNTPLFNVSAKVEFIDRNKNVWPLELFGNGQTVNIKFMFIKKNLIKNLINSKV